MKAIKYLVVGALLFSASPLMAQSENQVIIENVGKIFASQGGNVDEALKDIVKKNKKNPEVLVAIGYEYLHRRDTANAELYADMALKRDNKYAKAWILKGDIAVLRDNGGEAASMYQNAMYFDPKEPDGYYKYALVQRGVNPQAAVDALEELRKHRPDFPVDAYSGRIYYNAGKFEQAVEAYAKVGDVNRMEDEDINNYAISLWLLGKRESSIDVCKTGLAKNPRKASWNRVAFYCYTDMKDVDNALAYADKLFNQSDSAHFTGEDYTYYGTALKLAKRYDDALKAFETALEMNKDDEKQTRILNRNLSEIYVEEGKYDEAARYFQAGLSAEPTFDELDALGLFYSNIAARKTQANDAAGAAESFKKAAAVYEDMQQKFPNYSNYCNYMCAQINANLDPDSKEGLAKPYYEKLVSALTQKSELASSEKTMLVQAYTYLMVYAYNIKKDVAGAKEVAQKLLGVDPENAIAKQVVALK